MNKIICEVSNIIFDEKQNISDGNYLLLMNTLKKLNDECGKIYVIDKSLVDYRQRNIDGVIWSWHCRNKNTTNNKTFRTENGELFSYDLLIGYTENNNLYLKNYVANHMGFVSMTTSRHVGRVRGYCEGRDIAICLVE